jgi:hypothetical protein
LSDDEVVGAVTSTDWESHVTPVEARDEADNDKLLARLELTREAFFQLISVVDPVAQ